MCAQKLTDASLIATTQNQKLQQKREELKIKVDTEYAHKKRCRARNHGVSPEGGKGSLGWKGFMKQAGFEPGVKKEEVMDGNSGESVVENEVAGVGRDAQRFSICLTWKRRRLPCLPCLVRLYRLAVATVVLLFLRKYFFIMSVNRHPRNFSR